MRRLVRATALALTATLTLVGVQVTTGSAAAAAPRTLFYDVSRAGEFVNDWHRAAEIWNSRASNVRLQAGRPANITILVDNGWPRAQVSRLGSGRVWMGRRAVNDGHYTLRIATHELGHILGLPDRRTGRCNDLMSGSSAGTSCRNPNPNSREVAEVDRNFASSASGAAMRTVRFEECEWATEKEHAHTY